MKKMIAVLLGSLALAGCGSTGKPVQLPQDISAEQQKNVDELKKQAQTCFNGVRSFTKKGREEYLTCLVPPERKVAARQCLDKDLKKFGIPFTKKKAHMELQWLADCIVRKTGK